MKQMSINSSSSDGMTTSNEQQLKYENERLKLALAQRYTFLIYNGSVK